MEPMKKDILDLELRLSKIKKTLSPKIYLRALCLYMTLF